MGYLPFRASPTIDVPELGLNQALTDKELFGRIFIILKVNNNMENNNICTTG